jgi:hypothetical protein
MTIPESSLHQIFFATVRITVPNKDGSAESIGTGFILSTPLSEKDSVVLLVSNKHVFQDPSGTLFLNFHSKLHGKNEPDLGKTIRNEILDFSRSYTAHPNPDVDLACINISVFASGILNHYFKHIPSNLIQLDISSLLPGSDVVFIGYPRNRYDVAHNLPLLRRGSISSYPAVDFNGKKQFVIDAQVYPGSSGSPVFAVFAGQLRLIGVVSETMIFHEKLQSAPTAMPQGVELTMGLGIVISGDLVMGLLEEAVRKQKEKSLPKT